MANFFEWDPSKYALGVADMDREHETLIGLMNKLHALSGAGASKAELGRALQDLAKYTVKHFADEEAYMARTQYAGLEKHKAIHAELLRRVGEYAASFEATGKLGADLFSFLKLWLKAHICNIDAKYAGRSAAA